MAAPGWLSLTWLGLEKKFESSPRQIASSSNLLSQLKTIKIQLNWEIQLDWLYFQCLDRLKKQFKTDTIQLQSRFPGLSTLMLPGSINELNRNISRGRLRRVTNFCVSSRFTEQKYFTWSVTYSYKFVCFERTITWQHDTTFFEIVPPHLLWGWYKSCTNHWDWWLVQDLYQ